MLDLIGVKSFEQAIVEDRALHAEVATIAHLIEESVTEGRTLEDFTISELRDEGLSSAAIEFVLLATPAQVRDLVGAHAAFMIKMHRGGGPGGSW